MKISGNLFHIEVVNYFRKLEEPKWKTLVSSYYKDTVTDTPREIDLLAETQIFSSKQPGRTFANINVRLMIECKYLPGGKQIHFWFDEIEETIIREIVQEINNIDYMGDYKRVDISMNGRINVSYFNNLKYAVLHDSNFSGDKDMFHKGLMSSLHASVDNEAEPSILGDYTWDDKTTEHDVVMNIPVLLFKGDVKKLAGTFGDSEVTEEKFQELAKDGWFRYLINYKHKMDNGTYENRSYFVDVVDFDHIDNYMNMIKSDARLVADHKVFEIRTKG
jgi:hypothetical protein